MRDLGSILGFTGVPVLLAALLVSMPAGPRTAAPPAAEADTGRHLAAGLSPLPDTVDGFLVLEHLLELTTGSATPRPRVIVMLVPDPLASSLDWMHDSHLTAVRGAMEQAGYVADRSWFPDPDHRVLVPSRSTPGVRVSLPEPEAFPGILLFRRSTADSLAVILTVGEVPTSGAHRTALLQALRLAAAHRAPADDTIRILGPTFSGSVPSLRSVLEGWSPGEREGARPVTCIRVVSGAATARGNAPLLRRGSCGGAAGEGAAPAVEYLTTLHDDEALQEAMLSAVLARLAVDGPVALLTETTSYGLQRAARERETTEPAAPPADAGAPTGRDAATRADDPVPALKTIRIPFPLNISSLRNEYARIPAAEETVANGPVVRPRLPLNLRSSPRAVPGSRSPLTPATLDLLMEDIVGTLRDHDVQAVGILASDIRDKLFLADVLRRRLPGLHLFTYEGNALLRRPDFSPSVRGMFVASTYPLLMEHQAWTATDSAAPLVPFPNEGAAGVFNAAAVLLGEERLMRGYRSPDSAGDGLRPVPPVWVTIVGRDRVLPVAVHRAEGGTLADGPVGPLQHEEYGHRTRALDLLLGLVALGSTVVITLLLAPRGLSWARVVGASWRLVPRPSRLRPAPAPAAFSLAVAAAMSAGGAALVRLEARRSSPACGGGGDLLFWVGLLAVAAVVTIAAPRADRWRKRRPWLRRDALSALSVAVLASAAPVGYLHARPPTWQTDVGGCAPLVSNLIAAALLVSLAVLAVSLARGGRRLLAAHPSAGDGGAPGETRAATAAWRADVARWMARHLPHALALGFGALALAHVGQLVRLGDDPMSFALYRYRALSFDSGLSILPVFFLATLGVLVGLGWARDRERLLESRRPLSRVDFGRLARAEGTGCRPGWEQAFEGAWTAVKDIDRTLSNVALPVGVGAGVLVLMIVWPYDIHTVEAVSFGGRAAGSVLLWASLLTGLMMSAAATLQLVLIHRHLKRGLRRLAETPLAHAFDRLPERLRSLGRLHVFDPPVEDLGRGLAREGYTTLEARMRRGADCSIRLPEAGQIDAGGETLLSLAEALRGAWVDDADGVWREALDRRAPTEGEPGPAPAAATPPGSKQAGTRPGDPVGSSGADGRRPAAPEWRPVAECIAVIEIARYVDWVLRHLRRTALLLLATILLTTASLEALPLAYHDVVARALMLAVLAATATMVYTMVSLGRDDVLSRINGTPPGRISWNGGSLLNVAVFVAIPVLVLLGAEVPPLGRAMFSWLTALLRAFNGV